MPVAARARKLRGLMRQTICLAVSLALTACSAGSRDDYVIRLDLDRIEADTAQKTSPGFTALAG